MAQSIKTGKSKTPQSEEIKVVPVDYSLVMTGKDKALHDVITDSLPLFKLANMALLVILFIMLAIDVYFLAAEVIEPKDRIINSTVVITFIGATAAEISAIIIAAISRFT